MQFYSNMKGRIIWERPTTQRLPLGGDVLFTLRIIWKIERHIKKKTIQRKTEPLRWPSGGFERVRVSHQNESSMFLPRLCSYRWMLLPPPIRPSFSKGLVSASSSAQGGAVPHRHSWNACLLPATPAAPALLHSLLSDGCISTRVY